MRGQPPNISPRTALNASISALGLKERSIRWSRRSLLTTFNHERISVISVRKLCVGLHTPGRKVYAGRVGAVRWSVSLNIRHVPRWDRQTGAAPGVSV